MKHKFHNVEFSHNEQVAIIEHAEQKDWTAADAMQTAIESDLKLSFSWDQYHDTALLSVTPKQVEHPFYGYVVSVRHSDIYTLLKVVLWLSAGGFDKLDPPAGSNGRYDW